MERKNTTWFRADTYDQVKAIKTASIDRLCQSKSSLRSLRSDFTADSTWKSTLSRLDRCSSAWQTDRLTCSSSALFRSQLFSPLYSFLSFLRAFQPCLSNFSFKLDTPPKISLSVFSPSSMATLNILYIYSNSTKFSSNKHLTSWPRGPITARSSQVNTAHRSLEQGCLLDTLR